MHTSLTQQTRAQAPATPISDAAFTDPIEVCAYLDMYAAAPASFQADAGMCTSVFGDGACLALKTLPSALFNRFLTSAANLRAHREAATEWMGKHANPAWNIGLFGLGQEQAAAGLPGLQQNGPGMAKFFLDPASAMQAYDTTLDVREVDARAASEFGSIVVAAFGVPASFMAWFQGLLGRANWRTYIAYENGEPIAVAAMFLGDGYGWCGVGGTLPAHRNKGAQRALLARRIHDARRAGLKGLAVDTGSPYPDAQPGPSYRNILRAGFSLSHVRPDYAFCRVADER